MFSEISACLLHLQLCKARSSTNCSVPKNRKRRKLMKEVQKLLKLVADGLKSLAQGVEAIAEKVDDTAKTTSPDKANDTQQPNPVKTAKAESKPAEPADSKAKTAGQPEKKTAPKPAEPVVSKAKVAKQPEKKTPSKPARKKAVKQPSATDIVMEIISRSNEGVKSAVIKAETGYEQKKVSSIVYKLKKQGKVKALKRGVYVKA